MELEHIRLYGVDGFTDLQHSTLYAKYSDYNMRIRNQSADLYKFCSSHMEIDRNATL